MTRNLCRATLMLLTVLLSATTAWAESAFSGGDGSEGNPYIIKTFDDWNQIASHVSNGDEGYATAYYRMDNRANPRVLAYISTMVRRW